MIFLLWGWRKLFPNIPLLVLFAPGNIGELGVTLGNPPGPFYKSPWVKSPFHIIAVFAARSTIFYGVIFVRIHTIYTIYSNLKIYMLTVHTWPQKHRLGLFIRQVPFDVPLFCRSFYGVETRVHVHSGPPGCVFGIFSSPGGIHLVIVLTELFWTLFELSRPPFHIILLFALKFIVIFFTFWFLIILFCFCTALETRGNFLSVFIKKLV